MIKLWKIRIAKYNDNYHIKDEDFDEIVQFKKEGLARRYYIDKFDDCFYCDLSELINGKWEVIASSCNGNFIR